MAHGARPSGSRRARCFATVARPPLRSPNAQVRTSGFAKAQLVHTLQLFRYSCMSTFALLLLFAIESPLAQ
eukprot:4852192-Alexandrium_andersonii.AAC.1